MGLWNQTSWAGLQALPVVSDFQGVGFLTCNWGQPLYQPSQLCSSYKLLVTRFPWGHKYMIGEQAWGMTPKSERFTE